MGASGFKPKKSKIIDPEMILASKSICKISNQNKISSGFLIKLFKKDKDFYCFMTNNQIISKEMINKKEKISFYYDNEQIVKEIILNPNERFIKDFNDIGIDVIVVEILPKDNIDKNYFLLPVIDYIFETKYLKDKEIIIIQNQFYITSKIKEINNNNNEFTFLKNKEKFFTGNPIFLKDSIKVIGICKNSNNNNSENYADFIGDIFNYFKNFEQNKNIIKSKCKDDYTIDDDTTDLIIDPSLENDIELNENINEPNEGNFINGKLEGNGKYIYKNGNYYIGQFKNDKFNGKGILYNKNGNIIYEGDFINGKIEGNGKHFYKNGQYYVGQFKNNKRNGKGILYYKNGNVMCEGDFINEKYEGDGKYFWKNGQYYVGQFKNGKRNGKGIIYYKNGNIKCSTNI